MKYLLFDRILEFEPNRHVVAQFTLPPEGGDAFRAHFPRRAVYPGTLVVEAMVQALGWLVMASRDYGVLTVLTGLEGAATPTDLAPGTVLKLGGELQGANKRGSVGGAWAEVDGDRVGSIERVIFGHLPHPDPKSLHARFREHGGAP